MEQLALAKTKMLALTTLSPHGKLTAYASIARQAVAEDPEFYAHLVSWNAIKGEVRDARIALPLYGLRSAFAENASAHLAALDPRSLLKQLLRRVDEIASGAALAPRILPDGSARIDTSDVAVAACLPVVDRRRRR